MALKDLIGQERAVDILLQTLRGGRIPSAYLFTGESGVGKRFAAINLAKAINCLNAERAADACNACQSCAKIDAGSHPDLIMIVPEKGEIRVDEIRAVEDALSFRPYEGKKKVVIIDDADTMNQSAANAFLKTLEEPPGESLLVLIASNPDRLTETIRSRCSRIRFATLSTDACMEVIRRAASEEPADGGGRALRTDSRIRTAVKLSMGRPGVVLSSDLLKERSRFVVLLQSMIGGDNETWEDREEMERWLDLAALFLRDMASVKIMSDEEALFNGDIAGSLARMSSTAEMRSIIDAYHAISLLKRRLDFHLNKAITWNYTASVLRSIGMQMSAFNDLQMYE